MPSAWPVTDQSMTAQYEIRADYDRNTIVVYQAYNAAIAEAAIRAQRFVTPFSIQSMTWIKPSFLWLMERSGWGTKSNQERILAVRITRAGWEQALSQAVLTSFTSRAHSSGDEWRANFAAATVHVQWDPERSLHGKKLDHRSIQVGLSRHVIQEFVDQWTTMITDVTPLVAKLKKLRTTGEYDAAKRLLPKEKVYEVKGEIKQRLGME
jgi:hypothetical protein